MQNNSKGFTLIETLVAIFVLLIAVSAAFSAATSSLQALFGAQNRTIAFFLAQEGSEFVKNWRDENSLLGQEWDTGFSECSSGCQVDAIDLVAERCLGNDCRLHIDPDGFYRSSEAAPGGSTESRFSRSVTIEEISDYESKVTSTVTWGGLSSGTLTVVEHIYDWRP